MILPVLPIWSWLRLSNMLTSPDCWLLSYVDLLKNWLSFTRILSKPLLQFTGKSMGSRVSRMVAAENGIRASAVVCFGYPLKGSKGTIRDEPLLQLTVSTMFVRGTKDGLRPLESLEVVRKKMKAYNKVHVVENGDHSIKIGKTNLKLAGITQEEAEQSAVQAVAMFVSQTVGAK